MFCAFVDFEKAFDTVWRDALWYKLLLNQINDQMYTIILNVYTDVKSCITYNYCKSDYFNCDMGVRQGENLYRFLFAMFLNDLQMFFENASLNGLETVSNCIEDKLNIYLKLFALLYADDTVLMAETHDDLQNILNKFGEYCNTWRLKANTDKTKVIVFSRRIQSTNLKFTLNGSELEIVNEFNYLGILFNRTGNFNKIIKKQAEKATKAMFEVLKRGRTHNLSIECQLELFNKMVKPIYYYMVQKYGVLVKIFNVLKKYNLDFASCY